MVGKLSRVPTGTPRKPIHRAQNPETPAVRVKLLNSARWQLTIGLRTPTQVAGDFMLTILLILVVLMMLGALPRWPHSRNWGYYPSGGLGLILIIVIILVILGY